MIWRRLLPRWTLTRKGNNKMNPIPNWANIPIQTEDYERLEAGAYVCTIINAAVLQSKTGKDMLKLAVDVSEGKYDNIFYKQYQARQKTDANAKWPAGGVYYQLLVDDSLPRFRGLIHTLETANPLFKWLSCNWNEKELIGLKFGGIFREEEYLASDGTIKTSVKIYRIVPIEGLAEQKIPEIKRLKPATPSAIGGGLSGTYVKEEDIPF